MILLHVQAFILMGPSYKTRGYSFLEFLMGNFSLEILLYVHTKMYSNVQNVCLCFPEQTSHCNLQNKAISLYNHNGTSNNNNNNSYTA